MPNLTIKLNKSPGAIRAAELTDALRQAGLRLTPQRLAVCKALAGDRSHPTAQALHTALQAQFPTLSRATIYNTLQTLVEAGLIHELGTAGDGSVHYDADPSPHVNLVCVRCHKVEDYADAPLAAVARSVRRGSGYDLQGARVVYYGICPRCRETNG
jgi:Fur family transcriptional regulator, peroxide stress response regulator